MSQSQLEFTGSESTPRNRTSWPAEDWAATRQPTAHVVQVDSTCSRSHGRDLNRYGLAVRAPTGQIWTVLPAKYELNGRPGNGATSIRSPRSKKSISASPAISSEKRVQRAHWMHRSRSSATSGPMSIGFAQ